MLLSYLKVVFFSNKLHEYSSFLWIPSPVKWNSKIKKWEYKQTRMLPYFLSTICLKGFVTANCVAGIYYGSIHQERVSKPQSLTLCMEVLTLLLVAFGDIILCRCGREQTACANWAYTKEPILRKYGRNKFQHMCALLSIGFVLTVKTSVLIVGIVGVLANLDPFLALPHIFAVDSNYALQLKFIRIVLTTFMASVSVIGFGSLFLTTTVSTLHRIELLHVLSLQKPNRRSIALYKESAVAERLLYDTELMATTGTFSVLYVGIILAAGMFVLATEERNPLLMSITMAFLIEFTICLHILFGTGCSLVIQSGNVIQEWSKQKNRYDVKIGRYELGRILRSLKLISIPAGNVGIIDRELTSGYSKHLLENIVDSILTRRTLQE